MILILNVILACMYIHPCFYFDMYMSYGWGSPRGKFLPTVKGSCCQGHSLTEIKTFPEHKGNTSQRDNTVGIRQRVGRRIA